MKLVYKTSIANVQDVVFLSSSQIFYLHQHSYPAAPEDPVEERFGDRCVIICKCVQGAHTTGHLVNISPLAYTQDFLLVGPSKRMKNWFVT